VNSLTPKVVILGTGGTLAGSAAHAGDNVGYLAAQVGIAEIVAGIPALSGTAIETQQVAQVDSKDMSFAVWRELALRCAGKLERDDVAGVVVTHGTDTLEETAYFVDQVVRASKPVVFTCAMRPATSMAADGPQNVVDAVAVARAPGARGVVAVCSGVVHAARDVRKVHHYRLDPFSSGDAGPLGYVEEGRLRQVRAWPEVRAAGRTLAPPSAWPRVEVVMNYAGADGRMIDALVAQGVQGIVIAGTGNGTVHHDMMDAVRRAIESGVRVVRTSRTAYGSVIAAGEDGIDASDLSPVKARIELMLQLI
jgi:L-asparaginase